jgi:di/tricarboxylate transporter
MASRRMGTVISKNPIPLTAVFKVLMGSHGLSRQARDHDRRGSGPDRPMYADPTAIVVIWGSGIASGIVDNIPFTATMIPVIQDLAEAEGLSEAQVRPLWWSLALGADFGGNLTLIGASANVVVAGMSERAGQKISFLKFMLYGIPVTLASLALATAYVVVRYY